MVRLAIIGEGERAQGVREAIEAGSGMTAAAREEAEAVVAAGETAAETLALAQEALSAGKPSLCLSLPTDLATLDALSAAATRHGAALCLPNALRYLPATIALHETLQRGEAGALLSAFLAWRTTASGGAALATLGPAALDLLTWLVPGTLVRSQNTIASLFGTSHDAALLLLRDETGLIRTVELVTGLPPTLEYGAELLIEVLGEDAALRAEPFNQAITIATGADRQRREWGTAALGPLLADFVAAVRAGDALPGTPAALRPTLAFLAELHITT